MTRSHNTNQLFLQPSQVEVQTELFRRFSSETRPTHRNYSHKADEGDFLNRVDQETRLLVELMDIQDELGTIRTVKMQQRNVLEELERIYQETRYTDTDMEDLENSMKHDETDGETEIPRWLDWQLEGTGQKPANMELMRGTFEVLEKNRAVVENLLTDAAKVQRPVENLLTFKQMHASTMEARLRRKREEGAERSENVRNLGDLSQDSSPTRNTLNSTNIHGARTRP